MQKLAIITGGSIGIGRCLVQAFFEAGFAVAFNYKFSDGEAQELVAEIEAKGGRALAEQSDVGVEADVIAFYAKVVEWFGAAPDVLVNNAGIQTWAPLLELAEDDWDNVLQTNLKGCFLNIKHAAKAMIKNGKQGSIINIGSGCNKLAFPNLVDYTASKGGIEQLTKSAAVELGEHGINVNCVAPGAIMTARTEEEDPNYAKTWAKITPLARVGTPKDIAGPVLFLTTEAASFVTGQTIWVDGGLFSKAPWPYEN